MNLEENANHGGVVIRTVASMLTMSGLFVAARLYTRLAILKYGGVDDVLVALSWIFNCLSGGFACAQVRYGLGRHQNTVSLEDSVMVLKYLFFSIITYNISLTLTKIAVLSLYLRLIVDRRMKLVVYSMMVIVTLYGIETFIVGIVTCRPVRHFWDITIEGTCVDKSKLWITNAAINMATDVIIFVLPLPVIVTMRMTIRQRVALALVFGIGFSVCVISTIRLKTLPTAFRLNDYTWDGAGSALLSSTELSMAILCACLTIVRPLLALIAPNFFSPGSSRRSDEDHVGIPEQQRSNQSEKAAGSEVQDEKHVEVSTTRLPTYSVHPNHSRHEMEV